MTRMISEVGPELGDDAVRVADDPLALWPGGEPPGGGGHGERHRLDSSEQKNKLIPQAEGCASSGVNPSLKAPKSPSVLIPACLLVCVLTSPLYLSKSQFVCIHNHAYG